MKAAIRIVASGLCMIAILAFAQPCRGRELGARRGRVCPAYDPDTGILDVAKLAFDHHMELRPFGADRFGDSSLPALSLHEFTTFCRGLRNRGANLDHDQRACLLVASDLISWPLRTPHSLFIYKRVSRTNGLQIRSLAPLIRHSD